MSFQSAGLWDKLEYLREQLRSRDAALEKAVKTLKRIANGQAKYYGSEAANTLSAIRAAMGKEGK